LLDASRCRDIYLNECQLCNDVYQLTLERLTCSLTVVSTSEQYAQQLNDQRLHSEQMNERRQQLNLVYDRLDASTRTNYSQSHQQFDKLVDKLQDQLIEQRLHAEHYLCQSKEYERRLNHIRQQLNDIQSRLTMTDVSYRFEQIPVANNLYKVNRIELIQYH
jgi:exonuclease VII large subunit